MWTPTHVQVTVHRARNLIPKGKHGSNDAYVTIQLGKEKFQTTVQERAENPEWHEECDMLIGDMTQNVTLNVYHRNLLGLDEFLGNVSLPLQQFQIYERPKSRWFALKNKASSSKKEKYRGELETSIAFTVKNIPEREKLQAKLEKKKNKECDDLKVEAMSPLGLLKSTTSPSKLEKHDLRRHSMHPEILPTISSFETRTTDTTSQHSASLSSSTSSLTQCDTSLSRQSTGSRCTPKIKGSPLTPRSTIVGSSKDITSQESPKVERHVQKTASLDREQDDDYFSRTNAFRQSIGRGSIRRSSGSKRGSVSEKSSRSSSVQDDDIASYLMGGSAEVVTNADDTKSAKVTIPTPVKPPRRSSYDPQHLSTAECIEETGETHTSLELETTSAGVDEDEQTLDAEIERLDLSNHDNNNEKNDYRRHTLDNRRPRVTSHEIAETVAETQRLQDSIVRHNHLPNEYMDQFKHLSREDLIQMVMVQRHENASMKKEKRDLENYIDNLLVRVMEIQPIILQNPNAQPHNRPFKQSYNQSITQPHKQGVVLEVTRYNQTTPYYPPPAYSQPNMNTNNKPNTQPNRAKSPPKLIKVSQKKDRKSSNPFKRFSSAFK